MTNDEPYLFHLGEEGVTEDALINDEYRAGFYISNDQLVVEFGDEESPKNVALEFAHIGEKIVVEQILEDRNFWVQIINALSGALKEKM